MANPYEAQLGAVTQTAKGIDSDDMRSDSYNTREALLNILRLLKPHAHLLAGALLLILISVGAQLFIPIHIGHIIDTLVAKLPIQKLLLELICAIALAAISQKIQATLLVHISTSISEKLRNQVFEQICHLPVSDISKLQEGMLISCVVNDVTLVSDGLLQALSQLIQGIALIIGVIVCMLSLNTMIALAVVLLTPLSIISAGFIARKSTFSFAKQQAIQAQISELSLETFQAADLLRIYNHREALVDRFSALNNQLNQAGEKAQFISSLSNPATRLVNNILYAFVAALGFYMAALNPEISIGAIQAILTYTVQYTKPFNEISATITQFSASLAAGDRIFRVLNTKLEDSQDEIPVDRLFTKEITARNLDFSYDSEHLVLDDLNFTIQPGQKVALVGATGSGKTTLLSLLMRFYEPTAGDLLLGEVPLSAIGRSNLRDHIGMVLQESWIMEGTIAQNIALGKPKATLSEIKAAAKAVCADEFIDRLDNGYDTYLKPEDLKLSAGERQLLCITRCYLRNPDILLLDEATSALDSKTEVKVQAAFDKLAAHRTSIIVAHRLSTIRSADLILVLKNGHIIEQGSHKQLLAQKGFYSKLYDDFCEEHELARVQ